VSSDVTLHLIVNSRPGSAAVDPRMVLVEALRERFGVFGPKMGCLTGDCGACTVRVDGTTRKACLELAVAVGGAEITTIEGMADGDDAASAGGSASAGDRLTDVQRAFCSHGGFQCGFCLSGMLHAAEDLLDLGAVARIALVVALRPPGALALDRRIGNTP